jgi:hypothetical protein
MTQRSLATSAIECARLLNNLSTQLLDKEWETRVALSQPSIEDQGARYKIWGGSLGAFQRLPATSSLDYRVRESPKVATQIQELLEELRHALEKLSAIASGNIPNRVAEPDESDDDFEDEDEEDYEEREPGEGSDGSEDGVDVHVIIEIDVDGKPHQLSEASELFKSVKDTITSLFRISIIIRQASPRDRFAKALAAQQEPFDDRFDINHVSHKFPILNTKEKEWFKERVGKAITQRRQYLRYSRNHRDKLAREPQDLWQPEDICSKTTLLPVLSQAGKTNPTKPTSTLAPTAASTLRLNNIAIQEKDFQDDRSQTSYAVSLGEDDDEPYLSLPSLAEVSRGATTFECPLCWTIQDIQKESSWRKHVFRDLKPYICTFEDCDIKLFSDRREWFEHELLHHRAQWHCDFCGKNDFRSLKIFQDHIHSRHIQSMTDDQLDALGEASKRFVNCVPALDCPFCHEWEAKLRLANLNISADEIVVVTPDQFRSHVGAHMQQLALFSIPRGFLQDDADTKSVTSLGNPRSNVAGLRRAEMTLEFGSPEDALKELQKLHDQTPNDVEVHLLLSKCYHEIGNESAALEHSGRVQALRGWAQRGDRSDKLSDSGTKVSEELFVQVMETSSRVEEAEELQVQVMETTKRALGEEHPNTLTTGSSHSKSLTSKEGIENILILTMDEDDNIKKHPATLRTAPIEYSVIGQHMFSDGRISKSEIEELDERQISIPQRGTPGTFVDVAVLFRVQLTWRRTRTKSNASHSTTFYLVGQEFLDIDILLGSPDSGEGMFITLCPSTQVHRGFATREHMLTGQIYRNQCHRTSKKAKLSTLGSTT